MKQILSFLAIALLDLAAVYTLAKVIKWLMQLHPAGVGFGLLALLLLVGYLASHEV